MLIISTNLTLLKILIKNARQIIKNKKHHLLEMKNKIPGSETLSKNLNKISNILKPNELDDVCLIT